MKRNQWQGRRQQRQGLNKRKGGKSKNKLSYNARYSTSDNVSSSSGNNRYEYENKMKRLALREKYNELDERFGFSNMENDSPEKLGWLLNMCPTTILTNDDKGTGDKIERSALEMFFLQQDGSTFKALAYHQPYFYIQVMDKYIKDVKAILERQYEGVIQSINLCDKVDLDLANHLTGIKKTYLKLNFHTVKDLLTVRGPLLKQVKKNEQNMKTNETYNTTTTTSNNFLTSNNINDNDNGIINPFQEDPLLAMTDIREYDVPYYQRVSIDLGINVGSWYTVRPSKESHGGVKLTKEDLVLKAEPRVLAFDIECTKQPLKFPDSQFDQIFMISYMINGEGFLIINRAIVGEDINDFEYTPKPEYPGPFTIFNEKDEKALIRRFFQHCQEVRPNIYVTYNGDFFDWPFLDVRADINGLNMENEIGIFCESSPTSASGSMRSNKQKQKDKESSKNKKFMMQGSTEYKGRSAVHMDCLYWVNRDSYLPAGSRGLKAVTKAKLGYDPVEVDPELMVQMAQENPEHMASYSVSDAVATYYLYDKYIHLFVFSLCTIIPMGPDDVLRKGSGTLCESLLMTEARVKNIICPNKQQDKKQSFTSNGQLLEQETYVGGHVECLESGVYREDIPCKFKLDPDTVQQLIDNVDRDLKFALEEENKINLNDIDNYDEVRKEIVDALIDLRDTPNREEYPRIYHLDVAAMYPNIILTNRLQPCAVVDDQICASCDFNRPESDCKRVLQWQWRGDHYPLTRSEYNMLKRQLEYEKFNGTPFHDLNPADQDKKIRARVKDYCQITKRRVKDTSHEVRDATICQRENPFYVDTVRAFRDRRYEYKQLTKTWAKKKKAADNDIEAEDCATKVVLFDSLQLAHKCILNSFYGYVMRRGARWYSMEMAGVVTHIGANLIKEARVLVENVGRPLELDTDGIWCVLPASFPENFSFKIKSSSSDDNNAVMMENNNNTTQQSTLNNTTNNTTNDEITKKQKSVVISYPCVMLNANVHDNFTNDQYQDLTNEKTLEYKKSKECSIFFELDGPYRCMVLPASTEEGKLLKKRYAVFNPNGTLAELKGFELKRRGELKIIKIFQSQVFEKFLDGTNLKECYEAVGKVADNWLQVLLTKGENMDEDEIIDLISENRSMSRTLAEYGDQKSTSISTAKRLAEFLGQDMVKDKGLACKLLIADRPVGAPTTERAIPTAIFSAEPAVRNKYLKKWLKDNSMTNFDVRAIIDWNYYTERLGKAIQKIITIPAAIQKISNPVPNVPHPDWLLKLVREKNASQKQRKINQMFKKQAPPAITDMEDIGDVVSSTNNIKNTPIIHQIKQSPTIEIEQQLEKEEIASPQEIEEEDVDYDRNYDDWVKARARKWREKRNQRKRMERDDGNATLDDAAKNRKSNTGIKMNNQSLSTFARNQQLADELSYWQIIEIRQATDVNDLPSPGLYNIFALTSNRTVLKIPIKVPRIFYFNTSNPNEDNVPPPPGIIRTKVTRTLPHNQQVFHLYKVEMDESIFRRNAKQLTNFITRQDIHGVYEMQVPNEFRIISTLGCAVKVNRDVAKLRRKEKRNRDPYDITDLESLSTATNSYLESDTTQYKRIFLYQCGTGDRQVVSLYFVDDTINEFEERQLDLINNQEKYQQLHGVDYQIIPKRARCYTFITNRFDGAKPNPKRFLNSALEELNYSINDTDLVDVKVKNAKSIKEMWTLVSNKLTEYSSELNGPTLVILQAAIGKTAALLRSTALRQFPVVSMFPNDQDSNYPPLQWQKYAVKLSLNRYLAHTSWWTNRIQCSRYSHVPIGHVGEDYTMTMSDIFFTRMLVHNKHLLWASPSNLPDLGGSQNDTSHLSMISKTETPSINVAGSYRSICISFDVSHLAISTIIEATRVNELDCGIGGTLGFDEMPSSSGMQKNIKDSLFNPDDDDDDDEQDNLKILKNSSSLGNASDCVGTFKILRAAVQTWFKDVFENHNPFADELLVHFYRWISSPDSILYDPALHKFLHDMMTKVFYQLLAEMKRLGSFIVFANFNRVIINTHKTEITSAIAFCDHLTNTLRSNPLFKLINLTAKQSWSQLLFMDESNYGGISLTETDFFKEAKLIEKILNGVDGKEPKSETTNVLSTINNNDKSSNDVEMMIIDNDSNTKEDFELIESLKTRMQKKEILSHWNICDYLPIAVQDSFQAIIGEFIYKPAQFRDKYFKKIMEKKESLLIAEKNYKQEEDNYLKQLVRKKFSQKLLRIVPEIELHHMGEEEFPKLAGSYLTFNNPALEFVKSVCAVLNLDSNVTEEVHILKKNLLRQLRVREFSDQANFKNPSLSLILSDVICPFCNYCSDLDLCRDPRLLAASVHSLAYRNKHLEEHGNEYESDVSFNSDSEYEEERRVYKEHQEDLKQIAWACKECNHSYDKTNIEGRLVEEVQQLSMSYQLQDLVCIKCNTMKNDNFSLYCECSGNWINTLSNIEEILKPYVNVARFHGFHWLEETCEWLLEINPSTVVFNSDTQAVDEEIIDEQPPQEEEEEEVEEVEQDDEETMSLDDNEERKVIKKPKKKSKKKSYLTIKDKIQLQAQKAVEYMKISIGKDYVSSDDDDDDEMSVSASDEEDEIEDSDMEEEEEVKSKKIDQSDDEDDDDDELLLDEIKNKS